MRYRGSERPPMRKDARQLARDVRAMTDEEFSAVFEESPMKCATLRGPKPNARACPERSEG